MILLKQNIIVRPHQDELPNDFFYLEIYTKEVLYEEAYIFMTNVDEYESWNVEEFYKEVLSVYHFRYCKRKTLYTNIFI